MFRYLFLSEILWWQDDNVIFWSRGKAFLPFSEHTLTASNALTYLPLLPYSFIDI